MIFVRSYVAVLLVTVWSIVALSLVLQERDTGVLTVITPPLFLLVGGLVGVDFKKEVRRRNDTE